MDIIKAISLKRSNKGELKMESKMNLIFDKIRNLIEDELKSYNVNSIEYNMDVYEKVVLLGPESINISNSFP